MAGIFTCRVGIAVVGGSGGVMGENVGTRGCALEL